MPDTVLEPPPHMVPVVFTRALMGGEVEPRY